MLSLSLSLCRVYTCLWQWYMSYFVILIAYRRNPADRVGLDNSLMGDNLRALSLSLSLTHTHTPCTHNNMYTRKLSLSLGSLSVVYKVFYNFNRVSYRESSRPGRPWQNPPGREFQVLKVSVELTRTCLNFVLRSLYIIWWMPCIFLFLTLFSSLARTSC